MQRCTLLLLAILLFGLGSFGRSDAIEPAAPGNGMARDREPEIWSGRTFYFEKPDSADWTLPEFQDCISPRVRITREHTQGIFNIAQEDEYDDPFSPIDTEWATGDAVDWASLDFEPWLAWHGAYPPGTVGVDAVVHLISEDIYVDIRFESWSEGGTGGGFAYSRAIPDAEIWSGLDLFFEKVAAPNRSFRDT